jgi:PASTA domain-containing protein
MNRLNRIVLITGLALAGSAFVTAIASANTVKIGSDLSHPMDTPGAVCTNCTTLQQTQAGGSSPLPLSSPANGVVTSWAVRTSDPGALYTLRILRPVGTNTYLGAGTSPGLPVPPGTTDSVVSYPASLAIKQGDFVGILTAGAATGLPQRFTNGAPANVIANDFTGGPPDGAQSTFTPDQQHELLLQATVQFCSVPNVHKRKKKAAKALIAAADCGVRVKKKETHKKKFRGKVLKQKLAAGTTAAPGTVVPIVIGKKS